jgi:hypothetical protein
MKRLPKKLPKNLEFIGVIGDYTRFNCFMYDKIREQNNKTKISINPTQAKFIIGNTVYIYSGTKEKLLGYELNSIINLGPNTRENREINMVARTRLRR